MLPILPPPNPMFPMYASSIADGSRPLSTESSASKNASVNRLFAVRFRFPNGDMPAR